MSDSTQPAQERLSVFDRGPIYRLCMRAGLADSRDPGPPRLWLMATAVAWLPLVIVSLLDGNAYGALAGSTVLSDWAVTGRLLITMPLLIALQRPADVQFARIAECFQAAGLVADDETSRFSAVATSTVRLAHSSTAESILVVLAFAQAALLLHLALAGGSLQWITDANRLLGLSLPGWWAMLIALPMSTVVTLRWLWRVALWWRFCWLTSRLRLRLVASHPDGAGGLAYLNLSLLVFSPVAAGLLAGLAGQFATRILAEGAGLAEIRFAFAGGLTAALILFAGPLLLFTPCLVRARIEGIAAYGSLVSHQGRAFEARWLSPDKTIDAESLEVPDFSSRTDLNQVGQQVYEMRLTVLQLKDLMAVLLVAAFPFLPVLLLLVPAKQIFQGLVGLFL